jgi:hypothetical protein
VLIAINADAHRHPPSPRLRRAGGHKTFDNSQTIALTAKLTRLELINPHSWIEFDVTAPDGNALA